MKLSRFLATAVSAGLCLLSFSTKSEPLYWQATNGNITFMLIGSIHLGNQSMYPLPDAVMNFLANSDGLILEADLSQPAELKYPSNTLTTKQVLNESQQVQLITIAKQLNINAEQLLRSAPWATAMTLQVNQVKQLGYQTQLGIDQYLTEQAQELNRPILGLETLQYQIDILANLKQEGAELLVTTLASWNDATQTLPCLFKSWIAGDQQTLRLVTQEAELTDEVAKKLETERNNLWVEKLTNSNFLPNQNGNYLIAVGALHLIGQENVLTLLEKRGFQVTQLSQSRTEFCLTREK